jgi:hypothetical protein
MDNDNAHVRLPTQLKFETSAGGALIWITIMHMFGYLDLEGGIDAGQLFGLLTENGEASSYIGVRVANNNVPYVSMNSFGSYLAKWTDEDIAEALSDQLSRVIMALLFGYPQFVKNYGVREVRP